MKPQSNPPCKSSIQVSLNLKVPVFQTTQHSSLSLKLLGALTLKESRFSKYQPIFTAELARGVENSASGFVTQLMRRFSGGMGGRAQADDPST